MESAVSKEASGDEKSSFSSSLVLQTHRTWYVLLTKHPTDKEGLARRQFHPSSEQQKERAQGSPHGGSRKASHPTWPLGIFQIH